MTSSIPFETPLPNPNYNITFPQKTHNNEKWNSTVLHSISTKHIFISEQSIQKQFGTQVAYLSYNNICFTSILENGLNFELSLY